MVRLSVMIALAASVPACATCSVSKFRRLTIDGTDSMSKWLLGLFGTVVGMIQMFLGILDHGVGDVNQLAGGIGKALVCTAAGMIVAIPALMFHRYFRGRVAEYIVEMEHEAIQLLDTIGPAR